MEMEISHKSLFMAGLKKSLDGGSYSDLTVVVGDVSFPCHKVIVKSMSPYMVQRLSAGDGEMTLEDVDVDAFRNILNFMYTGVLPPLHEDNIVFLINTATVLQMDDFKLAIEEEFRHCDLIGAHNYLTLHDLAIKNKVSTIKMDVYHFILRHFEYIWKKGELNGMSFRQLYDVVLHKGLIVSSEFVLLIAIVDWVLAQSQLSWDETKLLIYVARMPLITEQNIQKLRCTDQVAANQRLSSLLLEIWERDHTEIPYKRDRDPPPEAPIKTYMDYL
ncbi:kelch-like protein 41b [Haliotis rufescens]|uniref:kelch-like protein 41b n=1 Tax=Haliotis rufescens TaxID=6454 RepID=UPI00201E8357|nr:kelch-like protein 41b [Haliotis rufescens]